VSRMSKIAAAGLGLGLLMCGCSTSSSQPTRMVLKAANQRRTAPDFMLKDADGKTVRLSDYRGKVVLLDFWATWCGPCKIEIPWFMEFERQHKDKGFAVIGVSMDEEGWDAVKPFVNRLGVNYRIVVGDDGTAEQFGGIEALPTTFLLDRDGKIAAVHVGLVSKSDFEHGIRELLETRATSAAVGRRAGLPAFFARAR